MNTERKTVIDAPQPRAAQRRVLGAPGAHVALLRGFDVMAAAVRPTLGPVARTVAITGQSPRSAPEVLDNAAIILRRTIQIRDPFADMGAMLVRQLAWSVFAQVGDGAATAVILAHALLHAAAPARAAGANAQALRRGLERGLVVARGALRQQAAPVDSAALLAHGVRGIVRDAGLAETIGELVESVGPDGAVLIEDGAGTTTTAEYIDGQRWNAGLLSPFFLGAGETAGRLRDPCILITDRALTRADELLPALEACVAAGERRLLVIAPEVSAAALGLLIANRDRGIIESVLAVRAPATGEDAAGILADIAVSTGARPFLAATGSRLADVTGADLGRARMAWATTTSFSVIGGCGDRDAIRRRVAELKAEWRTVPPDDDRRRLIRERIGKLAGTAAIVSLRAPTDAARAELRSRIEAAVTAAQAALRDGAVPGGGAALLACIPAVSDLADNLTGDEAVGARVLAAALTAPAHAIAANAGIDADALYANAIHTSEGQTFDVIERAWVDAREVGIIDPLPVVLAALEGSVSAAAMALTTDVLVRHKNPARARHP